MTPLNVSQTYHTKHKGLDIWASKRSGTLSNGYGEPLCAPEDVEILSITGDKLTEGNKALEHGFGVFMKGLETGYSYLFWHTLGYLPVKVGEVVKRGKIVGYMANSGYVFSGGVYVPLEERNKQPFNGTHLHLEMFDKGYRLGGKKKFINPLDHLNWSLQPEYGVSDQLGAISKSLGKMLKVLK